MPKLGRDGRLLHSGTVATQHTWYFWKRGIFLKPQKLFAMQLVTQLKLWQSAGEEIILFADMNENIYTGSLGRRLWPDGLLMEEQTLRSTEREAPHSHQSGQVAIVGTFATLGIVCTNSYLSPHGTGIRNHRFQIHDFDAHSVLGTEYLTTVRPSGQALHCKVVRTVNNYNKVLKQLLVQHRSFEKLEFLQQNHSNMSAADFQLMYSQWDREVTWLMLGSEKRCNKFRDGSIEFSPVIGLWIRRIQVYRWICRYLEEKVEHAGNLYRTCHRLFVPPPHLLTLPQVTAAEEDCKRHLEALRQSALKLPDEHLRSCLDSA